MMNKYKLIAIDCDGTLLDSITTIHKDNIKTIKKLKNLGYKVVIATGRPFRASKNFYNELELNTPMINYNGAYIHSPNDPNYITLKKTIDKEFIIELENNLGNHFKSVMAETEDEVFVYNNNPKLSAYFWQDGIPVRDGKMKDVLTKNVNTIIIELKSIEDIQIFNEYMSNHPNYIYRYWGGNYPTVVELFVEKTNKAEGLRYIADYYNIKLSEIIAIGDADNDVDMIKMSGLGIAMKNADEDTKQHADLITDFTCKEGGVSKILEKILL